jgi:hypothetical protein
MLNSCLDLSSIAILALVLCSHPNRFREQILLFITFPLFLVAMYDSALTPLPDFIAP